MTKHIRFFYEKLVKVKPLEPLLKWQRNISIQKKMPVLNLVQLIIPMLLLCVLLQFCQIIIRNQSISDTNDSLQLVKVNIDTIKEGIEQISQSILYDEKLYDIISNANSEDGRHYYDIRNDFDRFSKQYLLSNKEIEAAYLISKKKEFFVSDILNRPYLSEYLYDDLHNRAYEAGGKNVWYLAEDENKLQNVFIGRVIFDNKTKEEIGTLVMQINRGYLLRQCEKLLNDTLINIMIVDGNGKSIINHDMSYSADGIFNKMTSGKEGVIIDNRANMLMDFVTISDNWEIVTFTDLGELYKNIRVLWWIMLSIIVFLMLFFSIIYLVVIEDFLSPMRVLVETMENVGDNTNIAMVPVGRGDEIGWLAQNFNTMGARINNLITCVYKEELARKNTQLRFLQAQIDPHFLFNTFEMINWKAQMSGLQDICDIIYALSQIMNVSICRDDKMISLSEELEIIDQYMLIVRHRYGKNFIFKKNIRLEVEDIIVPKLLIQPLAENCFSHGFKHISKKRKVIMLRAYRKNGNAFLEIIDNGCGIPKEQLENINATLTKEDSRVRYNERNSVGISNVNERIRLFYGDEYGVAVESREKYYTKVTVKFRAISKKERGNFV